MADQDTERRLSAAAATLNRRAASYNTWAAVAVVLAIVLAVVFYVLFGINYHNEIAKMAKPDMVVNYVQTLVDANKDSAKKAIVETINTKTPELIKTYVDDNKENIKQQIVKTINEQTPKALQMGFDQFYKNLPKGREELEKKAIDMVDKGIEEFVKRGDAIVGDVIKQHKTWIVESLNNIKDEESAKDFENRLAEAIMTSQQMPAIKEKAQEFGQNFADAADQLERLATRDGIAGGLTPDEIRMKDILMKAKWLERNGMTKLPQFGDKDMENLEKKAVDTYEKATGKPQLRDSGAAGTGDDRGRPERVRTETGAAAPKAPGAPGVAAPKGPATRPAPDVK